MKILCAAVVLTLLLAAGLDAQQAATAVDPRLAQLTLPAGSGADWRQWDSFLTNIVKKLATDLPEPRRAQLQDLFLDSRYQLVQTLSVGQRFGLVEVTPDMLRGASKLLGTGDADPLAYVLDVDDNGGPRALGRYRSASTIPALKKVDEAFWAKFRSVSAGKEIGVKSCYGS